MACERGKLTGSFCSLAPTKNCSEPIECPVNKTADKGKNYEKICEPEDWSDHTFEQRRVIDGEQKPFDRHYEAHHILCVASVEECIQGRSELKTAVSQTEWCINQKVNMYAMPLWGHTVKWYCNIGPILQKHKGLDKLTHPPFENIPQHDLSHGRYKKEVEKALKTVASQIKDLEHKLQSKSLAQRLDNLSSRFHDQLVARGKRGEPLSGTHEAWKRARKNSEDETWCHPFSMASNAEIEKIPFPTFDDKTDRVMQRIAEAIRG